MSAPHIMRAIPRRRYQLGSFIAILLGDVESNDPVSYRYVMALVEEGKSEPCLFVTAERNSPQQRDRGTYRLRVILGEEEQLLESADEWGEEELFAMKGLAIVAKLYRLTDEQPIRLM